jgi:DNA recombination-dependent growth factor C
MVLKRGVLIACNCRTDLLSPIWLTSVSSFSKAASILNTSTHSSMALIYRSDIVLLPAFVINDDMWEEAGTVELERRHEVLLVKSLICGVKRCGIWQ